ncbi:MAG TPA: response regulator [Chloroflexota bacterium]|nr:response regulator [Chloroflexota bacterium]
MTSEAQRGDSARVLVVDDNRLNRLRLHHDLLQQGFQVTEAEDGRQALAAMRAAAAGTSATPATPFDLVLLDILMPVMDGYETLAEMKRDPTLRDLPVIVISALDEIDSAARCIEMGAEDYLTKPFNTTLLHARLRASLKEKKLRDLERAYLRQEVIMRQQDKLATIGKLSAGMAHELNNPAAAAQRGAAQLRDAVSALETAVMALDSAALSDSHLARLQDLRTHAARRAATPISLGTLERSDREADLERWLEEHKVTQPWELAPPLIDAGFTTQDLKDATQDLPKEHVPPVLSWLAATTTVLSLIAQISHGAGRIVELVQALKSYSYMDQAPAQLVDVHQGLDSTLVMLRSKLKRIEVRRDYQAQPPTIQAYGSELNQVWTNILDNAADVLDSPDASGVSSGVITIRTRRDADHLTVEIEDNGPGIPDSLRASVFDPFVTSKPPGHGLGLGLNISHTIICQRHKGTLAVDSRPGQTRFTATLPVAGWRD